MYENDVEGGTDVNWAGNACQEAVSRKLLLEGEATFATAADLLYQLVLAAY